MKKIWLFLMAICFHGCTQQPTATGAQPIDQISAEPELVWTNKQLYADAEAGKISEDELDHRFMVDFETCKIQALQIPIPSPACSTIPAPDCSTMDSISKTLCLMQQPYKDCDYSSVNAAYDSQTRVRDSCMKIRGWRLTEVIDTSKLSLVERYSGEDTERFIKNYLTFKDPNNLTESEFRKIIDTRWHLVRTDPEYVEGNYEFRVKTKDEFFKRHIAPYYPPEESETQKMLFETSTGMQDLIEIDKKINERLNSSE